MEKCNQTLRVWSNCCYLFPLFRSFRYLLLQNRGRSYSKTLTKIKRCLSTSEWRQQKWIYLTIIDIPIYYYTVLQYRCSLISFIIMLINYCAINKLQHYLRLKRWIRGWAAQNLRWRKEVKQYANKHLLKKAKYICVADAIPQMTNDFILNKGISLVLI